MLDRGWVYDESDGSYYLPEGVYDPIAYPPMTMIAPEPYFPDFDYKKLPWYTFPEYVQKYVYMPFKWDTNNYEVPFVLIRVTSTRASVFVGYNLGFGYDGIKDNYRVASPYFTSDCNSVCYYATFATKTYKQTADWQQLSPSAWGDTGKIVSYSSTIAYSSTANDFYFYGGSGVKRSSTAITSVSYPLYEAGGDCKFQVDLVTGYQSGRYFWYQNHEETVMYGQHFIPPSVSSQQASQQQQVIDGQNEIISQQDEMISQQDESNTKQQGIWDTLKDIPNMIAEKIKGLFVPEDGFFEEHINEYQDFFSEALGVIYELPETVLKIFNDFVSFKPNTKNYGIQIPEVVLPVKTENGKTEDLVIFEAQYYKFDFLNDGPFATLYKFYRAFVWLVILLALISFSIKKFNELTTGD